MVDLVRRLAVDPTELPGPDNPIRQVVVNTHSPFFVRIQDGNDLLFAVPTRVKRLGSSQPATTLRLLPLVKSWRAGASSDRCHAGRHTRLLAGSRRCECPARASLCGAGLCVIDGCITFVLVREGPSDDGLIPHLADLIVRSGGIEAIGQPSDYSGTVTNKLRLLDLEDIDIEYCVRAPRRRPGRAFRPARRDRPGHRGIGLQHCCRTGDSGSRARSMAPRRRGRLAQCCRSTDGSNRPRAAETICHRDDELTQRSRSLGLAGSK